MSIQSRSQNDAFIHEVRSALTIAKVHVQLLARRSWPMEPADRDHLISRLTIVDEAMNRAARHVAKFVEETHRSDDLDENDQTTGHRS